MRVPLLLVPLLVVSCSRQPDPPAIAGEWKDDFERAHLGGDWHATADVYRLQDGALNVSDGYNHPLWLRKKLPRDAEIELDCWSTSPQGDLKVEAFGDGRSYDPDRGAYTSTGYVFIMGGWSNSKSLLAKGDEHGTEVAERRAPKVEPNRKYHWKIVRKGGRLDWYVDDLTTPFLSLDDPAPLAGDGHEYFGFNDWQTDVWFDNLTIRPAR
jgi:hypothetical protein